MKFKTIISMSISVLLSLLLTTSIVFGEAADAAAKPKQEKKAEKCPRTVKVLVEEVNASTFLEYKGIKKHILPGKTDDFNTPIPGVIKRIEKSVGQEVKTGDVVVVMDEAPIKKEIEAAKAKVKEWNRILFKRRNWKDRRKSAELQAEQIISKTTELITLKEEQLKQIAIKSPVDGKIDAIKVKEGDYISEGFVLGTIVNIEKVKIPLDVYVDKVKEGQKIKIKIKELSKTVLGVVRKDRDGSTVIVVKNGDKQILHGMNAHFRVLLNEYKNVVVLPKEKILKEESGEGAFAYIVNGKRAKKVSLKTGLVEKGMVLILEGLSIGDEMIVSEILSAKEGTLKETLTCLQDNKKIKIMEFDEVDVKFVKRKKGKRPVKRVTKEEKKIEKIEKKEIPVQKEKITKKPPKEEEEKAEEYPKVEVFVTYLINNKDTLKYKKFKKIKVKNGTKVLVYCNAIARDKLLTVIHKLNVEEYSTLRLEPDKYKLDVFFRKVGVVGVKEEVKIWKPKHFLSKFRVGANAGYYIMFDSNFNDVYGSLMSLGLDISYRFSEKLDIWLYGGISSKKKAIDWAEEDLQFKFKPLTLDLRYFFKRDQKWDIFAGAGLNLYLFEDINPIENVKDNAFGFNILGGTYFHLTQHLSLQFTLRFNMVEKSIENADNDLNMNSLELLLGLSYNL